MALNYDSPYSNLLAECAQLRKRNRTLEDRWSNLWWTVMFVILGLIEAFCITMVVIQG